MAPEMSVVLRSVCGVDGGRASVTKHGVTKHGVTKHRGAVPVNQGVLGERGTWEHSSPKVAVSLTAEFN
jgi:hypothetical protein